MYQLNAFDPQQFLQQHWQKQPVLIRGGFSEFLDPLDEHDLAGLAQEPDIDARIVSRQGDNWQVTQGPFTEFSQHCQGQWSLLVQGGDRYLDEASELLNAFNFVPRWRVDDLMVSFSVPGAGVGPHLDQYDVFIIQGKGSRRWQVGDKGQHQQTRPHPRLSQVAAFKPLIDEVLTAGDILYIPPGFPHCGEALEPCLNYSVGFRAPNQQELLSSLADFALQQDAFHQRYEDKGLAPRRFAGEVLSTEVECIRQLIQASLHQPEFELWLGEFLSKGPEMAETQTQNIRAPELAAYLLAAKPLQRQLEYKGVWLECNDSCILLHFGELNQQVDKALLPYIETLCTDTVWYKPDDISEISLTALCHSILPLVNAGVWELTE
ncbi:hypothetical protein GCM10009092_21940 [Bowmanella denitrificans]|uniref:JmjC domain-containing protein n=1 Tax=Bowmanella denitrificans TaxID=366582 RepID=A0ABN0X7U6_9ALTE